MKSKEEIIRIAQQVIKIESDSLLAAGERLGDDFVRSVELISQCKGRIIVTGIGKSAAIANKIDTCMFTR